MGLPIIHSQLLRSAHAAKKHVYCVAVTVTGETAPSNCRASADIVPALVEMVSVPVKLLAVTEGRSCVTYCEICWPAVTSIVRLPPAITVPAESRSDRL